MEDNYSPSGPASNMPSNPRQDQPPYPEQAQPSNGIGDPSNLTTQMPQPVAYDQQGRPLYAAPPNFYTQPQPVHMTRPVDPGKPEVPPDIMQRHEESKKRFPWLNLSDGEYVILAIKRHPFGLLQIWAIAVGLIGAFLALLFAFLSSQPTSGGLDVATILPVTVAVLAILSVLILIGAFVASSIYNNNRFYLTNESVIQEIQTGLFAKNEQTVSLGSVEDASFRQDGIMADIFNFGNIRLSTVGDETTYRFSYVSNPKKQLAILNDAVEAFKNGRRVHEPR